jgi:DUF971 family protein
VDPVRVDVERERGVTITWDDGRVNRFGLEELRTCCMCAQCRGLREEGKDAWSQASGAPPLRIESAREVGNWGLNLHWNDGHTTGIYTWEVLRAWGEEDDE